MAPADKTPATGGRLTVDGSSFKQLYDQNARRLYNFIFWTTGNRSVCDDILQTVFMKVWRSTSAPGSPGEQTAWLYTVARHACIDYFRTVRKHSEYNDEIGGHEEHSEEKDDGEMAWRQVAQLEETERAVVYLHLKLGYTYAEIGRLMDMTENNVRVKAFRALRKLRDILVRKGL
jgi:RNA polymerase sigma factor (sigma-70 family)